jgi:hypothetical protein
LFFAPLPMNLIVFLVLGMLPPRSRVGDLHDEIDNSGRSPETSTKQGMFGKAIPESRLWAAVTAIALPLPFAIALMALCTRIFQYYRWGVFRLTGMAEGRTQLEGTTWYQHHLWPAAYWRLWSDAIIHKIHQRVLDHIKRSAERD